MYALVRKVHSLAGLVLLLFTVMYFMSGALMSHWPFSPIDSLTEAVTEVEVALASMDDASMEAHAREQFEVTGRVSTERLEDGRVEIAGIRPGGWVRVTYATDGRSAEVVTGTPNLARRLVLLHRLHHYDGGLLFLLWGILYDFVAVAMIAFPLSGIYLWYVRTPDKRLGWGLLAGSWALMLGVAFTLYAG